MERLNGTHAWAALGLGIALWEYYGTETLSNAVDRYLEHPVKRVVAIGAVAITGAHLLNLYEHFGMESIDPYERVGQLFNKLQGVENGTP